MRELWFFPGELAGPRSRIPLPTDFGPDQNDGDPVIKWIHTQGLHISPRLIVSHSAAHGRPYSLRSVFCGPPPFTRDRTEWTGVYQTGPTATQSSTAQRIGWVFPSRDGWIRMGPISHFPRVSRRFLAWSLANPNMPQVMSSMLSPGTAGRPLRYKLATNNRLFLHCTNCANLSRPCRPSPSRASPSPVESLRIEVVCHM